MIRMSTLFYRVKGMVGSVGQQNANRFLSKGLNNEFSPSKSSIDRIMAYSKAYHYCKTKAVGDCEQILN